MIDVVTPVWIRVWTGWALALAALLVFFLVMEGIALFHPGPGDTLSETVWYLRDTGKWLYWLILDVVFLATVTFAWLLFHFRFQGGKFWQT